MNRIIPPKKIDTRTKTEKLVDTISAELKTQKKEKRERRERIRQLTNASNSNSQIKQKKGFYDKYPKPTRRQYEIMEFHLRKGLIQRHGFERWMAESCLDGIKPIGLNGETISKDGKIIESEFKRIYRRNK